MHVRIYVRVCVCVCMHTCMCMYVCTYVSMYVRMFVCLYVLGTYMCAYVCAHVSAHVCVDADAYGSIRVCTCTLSRCTCTCYGRWILMSCVNQRIRRRAYTCRCACTSTGTCSPALTRTHTQPQIVENMLGPVLSPPSLPLCRGRPWAGYPKPPVAWDFKEASGLIKSLRGSPLGWSGI